MDAYNIIKEKIHNNDYDFSVNLLSQLNQNDFLKISKILSDEIYKGNVNCYKFIRVLQDLNIARLMSTEHKSTLTDENWIILATNVYLAYPKPTLLDYIVEMARINDVALEQLKLIANERPDIIELPIIIEDIEAKKKVSPKIIPNIDKKSFEYYKLDFGAIVKVKKDKFLLYRLDPTSKVWIEDHEMFMEMARGSYGYEPIRLDDTYPYQEDLDQSKGIKL